MLYWAMTFFVISIVAAVFGFTDISAGAADIAKILFYGFITVTVLLVVGGVVAGRKLLKK